MSVSKALQLLKDASSRKIFKRERISDVDIQKVISRVQENSTEPLAMLM